MLLSLAALLLVACSRPDLESGAGAPAGEELYADQFSQGDVGPWFLEGDDEGSSEIVDGALTIAINVPNTVQFSTLTEPTFTDFVAELDVTQLAGDLESSYGLLFRMKEDGSFYRFDITGDGRFIVERRQADGLWTRLVNDWQSSPALAVGLGSTNRIRVEADGAQIKVYANGEQLGEFVDSTLDAGTLAVDAGTFGRPGLRVAFDNLVVWEP